MTNTHEARTLRSALIAAVNGHRVTPDEGWALVKQFEEAAEARAQVERLNERLRAAGNRLAAATFGLVGAVEEPFYGKPFTATPTFIACVNEAEAAAAAFRAAVPDPEEDAT
jgi:hypothetical protein